MMHALAGSAENAKESARGARAPGRASAAHACDPAGAKSVREYARMESVIEGLNSQDVACEEFRKHEICVLNSEKCEGSSSCFLSITRLSEMRSMSVPARQCSRRQLVQQLVVLHERADVSSTRQAVALGPACRSRRCLV